ncbi:MAG: hypothetical protein KC635_16315, partial [Myxococcales bacterium]|nr:hypothetical protein [Myxococcales bacterium]
AWLAALALVVSLAVVGAPRPAVAAPHGEPPGSGDDLPPLPDDGDKGGGGDDGDKGGDDVTAPDLENQINDPDETEPTPSKELPVDGLGKRPALPSIDRDLISPRQANAGRGSAQVDLAKVGEDLFLDLDLRYTFRTGKWQIAPQLPLRLRIVDEAPETDDVIRREDWDEPGDFARILQFVQFGATNDPYFFRVGELYGITIGHGSLVNRYFNTVDVDHYQPGVFALADFDFVGGEILLDNLLDPEILVGRAYLRPLTFFDGLPRWLRWLKVGTTVGADFRAPLALAESGGGVYANPDWEPVVLSDEVAGLFGLDLEVPVVSEPHFDLVPYTDVATVDGKGAGFHLGSYVNIRFTTKTSLRMRLEYRFLGDRYEAGYISPFYEIERYSFQNGDPKLARLRAGEVGGGGSGFHFEGDLRIAKDFRWALLYTIRGGHRGHDLVTRFRLDHLGPVRLTIFFARLGFDGLDNLYAADRTLWGTAVRVLLTDWFYVHGRVLTEWWLRHDETGEASFDTVVNFNVGVGIILNL